MGHRPVTVLGSPDHCMRRYSLRPSRAARSRVSGFVLWYECDIARSRMDVRFREKSGRAADVTGTTEFDPHRSYARLKSRSAAVLCYPLSGAREVLGSETPRVHHAARRRSDNVAARGCGRLATSPSWTGSSARMKTMGVVAVGRRAFITLLGGAAAA